jgi:RimJ/RimL family protein N-acetyltransferase
MLQPYILQGQHVRLEPLTRGHHAALCKVGLLEELWRWTPQQIQSSNDMSEYLEAALLAQEKGLEVPFATVDRHSDQVIGSTRFMNIESKHRRLEIGSTWIAPDWQRTAINTEAKYLMLCHAFGPLNCHRVEFKTDVMNQKSRDAILRIGAKQEGIFRNHMVTASGRVRDTIWFSIIDSEWPQVKLNLERRLSVAGTDTRTVREASPEQT